MGEPQHAQVQHRRPETVGRPLRTLLRLCMRSLLLCTVMSANSSAETTIPPERRAMLEAVRQSVRDSAEYTGRSTLSDPVIAAMAAIPREEFVAPRYRSQAYRNEPLPIEAGQTISQPLIVALMTELLDPEPGDVMLEVGTGSGYQAAVLGQLVRHVYSVEIVPQLAQGAAAVLERLGYTNISVRAGDGYAGWPQHAPFDGIIVTAAAEKIPPPLLQQLKPGGKLVIPVGEHHGFQELLVIEVDAAGEVSRQSVLPVRFVPLTGER